ncbi:MAG: hypothetical protein IJ710_10295 [Prevotella sp.]|nr:hypothetical protein [Prevotella sp.]
MKRYVVILLSLLMVLTVSAQEKRKFSPERFEAEMEAFITREASLTPSESAKFFPLLKEMHSKQRVIYDQMRRLCKSHPADEKACANAVRQCDKWNIELRKIEQTYHNKFFSVLPAKKVYDVIMAENRFHRQQMRGSQKDKR